MIEIGGVIMMYIATVLYMESGEQETKNFDRLSRAQKFARRVCTKSDAIVDIMDEHGGYCGQGYTVNIGKTRNYSGI